MLLQGLYTLLTTGATTAAVQGALGKPASDCVHINVAPKMPTRPFLVLNTPDQEPAAQTLDGVSDLIDGEIQLDSYGDTPKAAQALSKTVRDFLMKTFVAGQLPDGTNVQFVEITMEKDEPYEQGGIGYLYRRLLRLRAFYTEAP
jgi:hypothetical protein